MPRYRKKPVEIEAVQYDGNNAQSIAAWIDDASGRFTPAYTRGGELTIQTLEGDMRVSLGDYVIKGVKGEFYPCRSDIFAATYDQVEEA